MAINVHTEKSQVLSALRTNKERSTPREHVHISLTHAFYVGSYVKIATCCILLYACWHNY